MRGAPSVLGRMPAGPDPVAAYRDGDRIVEVECHHCGPARCCPPHDHRPIRTPLKVPPPPLAPGMEETDTPPGQGITPVRLLSLEQITRPARQPKVFLGIGTPARPGNDTVDFERPRHIRLARATIPTPVRCSRTDTGPQCRGNRRRHYGVSGARRPRRTASARASDCRTQSCWYTCINARSSACSCVVRGVSPCLARS
jgi:hypothetical protein